MPEFEKIHAIAVEDDEGSALLLRTILRRHGMDVHIHPTGENFLQFLYALPMMPNLILLDVHLPRNNGLDIVRSLRDDAKFRDVIAIAVSAVDPNSFIPKAKEAGFSGFIAKPINRETFPRQINRILNGEEIWETRR